MLTDKILGDNVWIDQKKVVNPDGTNNFNDKKKKTSYGLFNTCFVSSSNASFAQIATRLVTKGYTRITSGPLVDANAYFIVLLAKLNKKKDGTTSVEDNEKRYWWSYQVSLLNEMISGNFKEKVGEFSYTDFSLSKVIENINNGWQCPISIYIGDFHKGGAGHIVCPIGYSVDEAGNVQGLFVNDPAGNITSKTIPGKAYYTTVSGKEVYYDKKLFPKLFKKGNHMMVFTEKK